MMTDFEDPENKEEILGEVEELLNEMDLSDEGVIKCPSCGSERMKLVQSNREEYLKIWCHDCGDYVGKYAF